MPVTAALAVRFAHPWALVALAVVAVPPLVAARARRRGRRVGTLPVALQCAAVALTACALAGPMAPLGASAEKPYLLLRDVSASVRGQALPDWPDALPVRRHVFAENVAPQGTPVDASATRIVPALRLATAQADQLAGAVIVTDANFHDADWSDAAAALGRTGLPVAVVPLAAPGADARVTGLAAQRPPHAGGGVRLRATVTASASQTRRVSLRRVAPDERIFPPRRVELAAGASATVTLDDRTAPTDATAVYEARLLGKDAFGENDSARAVATPRRQRVAWVSSQGPPPGFADALGTAEVTVLAPDEATSTVDGWSPYAAVVLVDATGLILDAPRRAALGAYVRSAGGLVLVGTGPHRSPADRDDPLNAVAALTARPYERTPLKVVVVLDASGSMGEPAGGGRSRFDVAVEAVMAMEPHLMPHDALAVVTFSARARTVYDSGLSRPDFARLHDALRGARAGGPTHVLPALQRAAGLGATRDARSGEPDGDRRTLVILVSDLLDRRFDPDAAARLFGEHRHLAVVVAAAADDPRQAPLRELARRADAPLQAAADLGDLDELFVEFLRRL
ncbi:MAG: vWA domain-containing protein, partial [Planctomycetota bacterium]